MSALALFYSFVDEQTQKEANGVGCQSDDSVGLVVNCELFGHIEQFIRLKHDILTIEHSKGKDNGDKHRNCEQGISQPSFGPIHDEEGGSDDGE